MFRCGVLFISFWLQAGLVFCLNRFDFAFVLFRFDSIRFRICFILFCLSPGVPSLSPQTPISFSSLHCLAPSSSFSCQPIVEGVRFTLRLGCVIHPWGSARGVQFTSDRRGCVIHPWWQCPALPQTTRIAGPV